MGAILHLFRTCPFKVLFCLSFSRFKALGSSYSWTFLPCCVLASSRDATPTKTVSSSLDSSISHATHVLSGLSNLSLSMQRSFPTLVFKLLIVFPPTSYFIPLLFHHHLMFLAVYLYLLISFPRTPSGLNYFTLFRLILLTLFLSRNLTLTHLTLSGSLGFLICDLITPTLGLAFSLPIPCTLVAASSFSSGSVYPSLKFRVLLVICNCLLRQ